MAFFTNITILLVVACVSHQMMLGSCQKGLGRRGRGVDRGHNKDKVKSKSVSAQPIKGKLVTKDKSECTWAATGDDVFTLSVTCKKSTTSFGCEYVAKPSVCPRFASDVQLYWRQISRALRKHRRVCQERGGLIRAGMCRGAAAEAHFRLRDVQKKTTTTETQDPEPEPEPGARKSCKPGNRKLAEEYCNDSWSSFCTFFFTMVQDYDC